jgi:hypothetical protein
MAEKYLKVRLEAEKLFNEGLSEGDGLVHLTLRSEATISGRSRIF